MHAMEPSAVSRRARPSSEAIGLLPAACLRSQSARGDSSTLAAGSSTSDYQLWNWLVGFSCLADHSICSQRLFALSVSARYRAVSDRAIGHVRALGDPSLVSYRHPVGYRRSSGNLASYCLTPSAGVVCRCGQPWSSHPRLTAPEAASRLPHCLREP